MLESQLRQEYVTSDPPPHDDATNAAIDDLYRGPREDFIKGRNALARRLLEAGKRALSESVRALSKPSVSAWVVNQLWWSHREAYDALHAAGAELAALQRQAVSVAGQPANDARRAAILALRNTAEQVLVEAGHATSISMMRRITQSLEASAAGGSFGPAATLGRLHGDLAPPGFGQVQQFAAPASALRTAHATRRASAERARDRAEAELSDARCVLKAAELAVEDAQGALARAQRSVAEATATRVRTQARVAAAQDEFDAARAALDRLS
ncbi:MAG: hypothetical protein ACRBN8_42510 [Nannocystales bacterium]